ncbi:MAG: DUF2185 domain-containing protein [Clostridia bacterium]|nr:DUF2185 domain-containing protein [Clostridia bacterium]
MKKVEMNLNEKKVFFYHNTTDDIVNLFEETLKNEENNYNIIKDNKIIQIGFNFYKIKNINNEFQIFAVNYNENPFKDFIEDLTLSLDIMKNQLLITKKTGLISDETISFQDTILAKKAALSSNNLYFEKQVKKQDNDSGWYMGNLDDKDMSNNPEDYTTIKLYELLKICPMAISILNLPVGAMAIIKDNEIVGICDSNNKEVYAV